MKIVAAYLSFIIVFLFTCSAAAQQPFNCEATENLPNLGCINADLYRGAQPTPEGIDALARRGVKTIISLRNADDNAQIEQLHAQKAGIKFINIPLRDWFAPKDEKIEEILNLINSPENQPVFVHCKRGADRTGTVIAAYRIARDGWTAKQARAEAENFKFGWWQIWMKRYINDFYRKSVDNKPSPKNGSQIYHSIWDASAAVAFDENALIVAGSLNSNYTY